MPENTNMDLKKPSNMDGPQLEFTLPNNELLLPLETGQIGKIIIPVKVTQTGKETISFMKNGPAEASGDFAQQTATQMRENLPVADEDTREDMKNGVKKTVKS